MKLVTQTGLRKFW